MLTVEQCKNRIAEIEKMIKWLSSDNMTQAEEEWVAHLKRLSTAYAVEMAKALDRRMQYGEDEDGDY